jgi:hypothetical protein
MLAHDRWIDRLRLWTHAEPLRGDTGGTTHYEGSPYDEPGTFLDPRSDAYELNHLFTDSEFHAARSPMVMSWPTAFLGAQRPRAASS